MFELLPYDKCEIGDYVEFYNLPKYTNLLNIPLNCVISHLKNYYKLLPNFNGDNDIVNYEKINLEDTETDLNEIYFNKTIDLIYKKNNIEKIEKEKKQEIQINIKEKEIHKKHTRKPKTEISNDVKQTEKYKKRRARNTAYAKEYRRRTSGLKLQSNLRRHPPHHKYKLLNRQIDLLNENKAYLISKIYEKYKKSDCKIGYIIRKSKIYNSNN